MDFGSYAQAQEALYLRALGLSAHPLQPLAQALRFSVKKILIVAPHPDDECLMSGFALRAKEEFQAEVAVLPLAILPHILLLPEVPLHQDLHLVELPRCPEAIPVLFG